MFTQNPFYFLSELAGERIGWTKGYEQRAEQGSAMTKAAPEFRGGFCAVISCTAA